MNIVNLYTALNVLYDLKLPPKEEIDRIKTIISNGSPTLMTAIMESIQADIISELVAELVDEPNRNNVTIVLEEDIENMNLRNFSNLCNAKFYNHGLMKIYIDQEMNGRNEVINLRTNKFLYLMGKPYKEHRIGILHELFKSNLMQYCEHSFLYKSEWDCMIKNALPDMSELEYRSFIESTAKTLDSINIFTSDEMYFYPGFPTDKSLYANTSFSVISETHCNPNDWGRFTTEKTWRPIGNSHAFVMIAYKDTFDYLEDLGIDTFQYLLKYTKEDMHHNNSVQELNRMTKENIMYFLNNMPRYESRIVDSIKNNYRVYEDRAKHFRTIIDKSIESVATIPYYVADTVSVI